MGGTYKFKKAPPKLGEEFYIEYLLSGSTEYKLFKVVTETPECTACELDINSNGGGYIVSTENQIGGPMTLYFRGQWVIRYKGQLYKIYKLKTYFIGCAE